MEKIRLRAQASVLKEMIEFVMIGLSMFSKTFSHIRGGQATSVCIRWIKKVSIMLNKK
jgi:hypothetical protein